MTLNLVQDRSGPSVWDRTSAEWDKERWLTGMAAASLVLAGLRGRSTTGWLLLAMSGALAYWASTTRESRRLRRGQLRGLWPFGRHEDEAVSEALEETFPASDAPALTPEAAHTR